MFGVSNFLRPAFQSLKQITMGLHTISPIMNTSALTTPGFGYLKLIRNKVRCYFPRPNEVKRVRRHGWEKRMSTPNGRRTLMRRILKGRHVISH